MRRERARSPCFDQVVAQISNRSSRNERYLSFDFSMATPFEVGHTRQHPIPITSRYYGRSFLDPGRETIRNSAAPYLAKSAVTQNSERRPPTSACPIPYHNLANSIRPLHLFSPVSSAGRGCHNPSPTKSSRHRQKTPSSSGGEGILEWYVNEPIYISTWEVPNST